MSNHFKMKRTFTLLSLLVVLAVTLFISIQQPTHALQRSAKENPLVRNEDIRYNLTASQGEAKYLQGFESLNITLHPGSDFTTDDQMTPSSLNQCKSLVYRTLQSLPPESVAQLKDLTLYYAEEGRRGLGGGDKIILKCLGDKETVGVFVHEMGHIVDTGVLQGTRDAGASEFKDGGNAIYNDDPSLLFYRLNFKDEKTLRKDASAEDFVSGYATSDPFEDFAESYNYYVLHGDEFRVLKQTNKTLLKKYVFLKIWVRLDLQLISCP